MDDAAQLRANAARYRELAKESEPRVAELLTMLADEAEAEANRLEPAAEPPNPAA